MTDRPRRFPPPWSIEESSACFIVGDGDKQASAYIYYENEPGRRSSAKLMTRDEAFLIAVNIAKLPRVTRQILKEIPRPPTRPAGTTSCDVLAVLTQRAAYATLKLSFEREDRILKWERRLGAAAGALPR